MSCDEVHRRVDLSGLTKHTMWSTFHGTTLTGYFVLFAGSFAGAFSHHALSSNGRFHGILAGSIAIAGVTWVALRVTGGARLRFRFECLICLASGSIAFLVAEYLPREREWWFARWSVAAGPLGVLFGAFANPIDDARLGRDYLHFNLESKLSRAIDFGIRRLFSGRIATAVAGCVGAAIGAMLLGLNFYCLSPNSLEDFVGDPIRLIEFSAAIGAVAGFVNGWYFWPRAVQFMMD